MVLLRYAIDTVCDYESISDLLHKRMRWIVVMRHMRPWGHLGLLLTQGLPWSLAAVAIHPTAAVAIAYLGGYMGLRMAMTWMIGIHGLRQSILWKQMPLLPVWDAVAFAIWLISFSRNTHPLARRGLLHPGRPAGACRWGRPSFLVACLFLGQRKHRRRRAIVCSTSARKIIRRPAPRRLIQPARQPFCARRFARAKRISRGQSPAQNSPRMRARQNSAALFAPEP